MSFVGAKTVKIEVENNKTHVFINGDEIACKRVFFTSAVDEVPEITLTLPIVDKEWGCKNA